MFSGARSADVLGDLTWAKPRWPKIVNCVAFPHFKAQGNHHPPAVFKRNFLSPAGRHAKISYQVTHNLTDKKQ
jgi:hypothetical protein